MFQIRPFRPAEDLNYVTSSFGREYSRTPLAMGTPARVLDAAIKRLIEDPEWKLAVCHLEGFEDEICGWILWRDESTVGWVDVKHLYRRQGVARALVSHADLQRGRLNAAFCVPKVSQMAHRHGLCIDFRPYLAFPVVR
jgi:GNAT superfamily N-acetyltransferase